MIEITRERHVASTPVEVWAVVADPALAAAWFAFAERVEILDGHGFGQLQRQHGRWGRRRAEIDREIVEYDPPRSYAWRHVAERLDGRPAPRFARSTRFRITLEPDGAGTLVRLHSEQEPAGAVRGLVMRAFGAREVAGQMERSLDRLAALLQSQAS
jgi:uncharacterized protein YndB with AHSA1/START domain